MDENSIQIIQIETIGKGKRRIRFDTRETLVLYYSETRGYELKEGAFLSPSTYEYFEKEIVLKRAKKRALHLLEQMERTQQQLREKLLRSEYPKSVVEDAISYVKSFHYIDDERYAKTFVNNKKDKMSRQQMKQKLMAKGISQDTILEAIETEYDAEESVQIQNLLCKKHFSPEQADEGEFRRMYQYLLRRGFPSHEILKQMKP